MRTRQEPWGWVVCLESGENLRQSLEQLCLELGVEGAQVSGIGGLLDPQLGFWQFDTGEYTRHTLEGRWELLSLQGNISLYEGRPFAHLHVSLADESLQVVGGHFFEATVTATVELFLTPCEPIERDWDDQIGAALWNLQP